MTSLDQLDFQVNLSTPLVLEYEEVAKRMKAKLSLSAHEIEEVINYICLVGNQHRIFYLWRPFLKDPKDDLVLELAVAGTCDYIVTYNIKDFAGVKEQFGIQIVTPKEFLAQIGDKQ